MGKLSKLLRKRDWIVYCCCCEHKLKLTQEEAHKSFITCPYCKSDLATFAPPAMTIDQYCRSVQYYPHKKSYIKDVKKLGDVIKDLKVRSFKDV